MRVVIFLLLAYLLIVAWGVAATFFALAGAFWIGRGIYRSLRR